MAIDSHIMRVMKEAEQMALAGELEEKGYPVEKAWQVRSGRPPCDRCRRNAEAGWMPLRNPFPSGHQTAPAHDGCRCRTVTRIKPDTVQPGESPAGGDRVIIRWKH